MFDGRRCAFRLGMGAMLLLGSLLTVMHPATVRAATITATNFTDRANGPCATTGTGDCSLREAIIYANARPFGETIAITLRPGTYTLAIPPTSPSSLDDATGSLKILAMSGTWSLSVANGGTATIDGGNLDRVLGVFGSSLIVTITGVTFRNGMTSDIGGGVYNRSSTVTLRDCALIGNHASAGGGIATMFVPLTLINVAVADNSADSGGGIAADRATIIGSTITGNVATFKGGGIDASGGNTTIVDSTISNNRALYGGGISGTARVTGSTLSGNIGGAILLRSYDGSLALTNTTISGNTNGENEPVIDFQDNSARSWLTNVTIAGNGGGIRTTWSGSPANDVTLVNAILANNGQNCSGHGNIFSGDYNLVSDTSCNFAQPHDRQGANPLLGPLADNGGPTRTHALLPGSPAIDAGTCVAGVTTDQRGVARPQDAACDIGAFEYRFVAPAPQGRGIATPTNAPAPAPAPRSGPPGTGATGGQGTPATPNPLPPSR